MAFWHLMHNTQTQMINMVIYLRTLLVGLSPVQQLAAQSVMEMVERTVPRDWSLEAVHSFTMWAPKELQYVVEQVNEMETDRQGQAMVAAEAEALLSERAANDDIVV
jgi:hypothetical protein